MSFDYSPSRYIYDDYDIEWIDCPVCGYPHREDYNCQTGKRESREHEEIKKALEQNEQVP